MPKPLNLHGPCVKVGPVGPDNEGSPDQCPVYRSTVSLDPPSGQLPNPQICSWGNLFSSSPNLHIASLVYKISYRIGKGQVEDSQLPQAQIM